ncbi:MAG: orotidine-5'-phosphate decarboxylase [Rickettsiales bacterium]|nr:orotidine-5'-phosphate decarboxylase [Rickettsiales bacterium]
MTQNPIICAIDTKDIAHAQKLATDLSGTVGAIKLGLEFFTANGAAGVQQVAGGKTPVFLDLKFHDIPNTVAGALRSAVSNVDCFLTTVHTLGGKDMMQAAAKAAREIAEQTGRKKPLVLGVTVLTSMDVNDLQGIGVADTVSEQVKRLAALAQESGLDGVVCSPHEIEMLRQQCGKEFTLVVPGIRPMGSDAGDQKRVMTPREAIDLGASYLVIGRPITGAADPAKAAQAIAASLR